MAVWKLGSWKIEGHALQLEKCGILFTRFSCLEDNFQNFKVHYMLQNISPFFKIPFPNRQGCNI